MSSLKDLSQDQIRGEVLRCILSYAYYDSSDITERFNALCTTGEDLVALVNAIYDLDEKCLLNSTLLLKSAIKGLLLKEEYVNSKVLDITADCLAKLVRVNENVTFSISKNISMGEIRKLARHTKINAEEYFILSKELSQFFPTLRTNNPHIDTDEIKLLHELEGDKIKKTGKSERIKNNHNRFSLYGKVYNEKDILSDVTAFDWRVLLENNSEFNSLNDKIDSLISQIIHPGDILAILDRMFNAKHCYRLRKNINPAIKEKFIEELNNVTLHVMFSATTNTYGMSSYTKRKILNCIILFAETKKQLLDNLGILYTDGEIKKLDNALKLKCINEFDEKIIEKLIIAWFNSYSIDDMINKLKMVSL